jgi:hypothetical protein
VSANKAEASLITDQGLTPLRFILPCIIILLLASPVKADWINLTGEHIIVYISHHGGTVTDAPKPLASFAIVARATAAEWRRCEYTE